MKIISLVPSLTELLFHLGLGQQIIGRTKFCIHPSEKVTSITKIGGTKNVNLQKVLDLNPDLIIANKEENTKSDIQYLMDKTNVHLTEISNYEEGLIAIKEIGQLTATSVEASTLVENIERAFVNISKPDNLIKVCYLIWQKPYMTIGNDTYIHNMLARCGFDNIFGNRTRYPSIELTEIKKAKPDYIFLSTEPFPFKQKHIDELQEELPKSKILLVDGEYFSWYGNRMIGAAHYFNDLIGQITS